MISSYFSFLLFLIASWDNCVSQSIVFSIQCIAFVTIIAWREDLKLAAPCGAVLCYDCEFLLCAALLCIASLWELRKRQIQNKIVIALSVSLGLSGGSRMLQALLEPRDHHCVALESMTFRSSLGTFWGTFRVLLEAIHRGLLDN